MNPNKREWLDYPLEKEWRVRVYVLKSKSKADFRLLIEHNGAKDSVIRFDHGGGHKYFHIDILNKTPKPYKSFPKAKTIKDKIEVTFDYIRKELKYKIKYKNKTLNISPKRLEEIKNNILKELLSKLKMGKRTTSKIISMEAVISRYAPKKPF